MSGVAVTVTVITQLPLAGSDVALKLIEVAPAFAVRDAPVVPAVQFTVVVGEAVTVRPAGTVGNVSLKLAFVNAVAVFGFVSVIDSVLVPPGRIVDGLKDLLMVGPAGVITTGSADAPLETAELLLSPLNVATQ